MKLIVTALVIGIAGFLARALFIVAYQITFSSGPLILLGIDQLWWTSITLWCGCGLAYLLTRVANRWTVVAWIACIVISQIQIYASTYADRPALFEHLQTSDYVLVATQWTVVSLCAALTGRALLTRFALLRSTKELPEA